MKITREIIRFSLSASPALFCSACDPVTWAFLGTAGAGAVAVRNEEGLSGSVSDSALQKKVEYVLAKADLWDGVELAVKHGMIVVIGHVDDESKRERIMKLIKDNVVGSVEIYNEIQVGKSPNASNFMADSGITSRIKSSLLMDGNVASPNYDVTTVKGIVYICGTAQSSFERDVVLNHIRTTSGVKRTVAYIKINDKKKNKNQTN
jgi:osmotically-inducible protein OsmY